MTWLYHVVIVSVVCDEPPVYSDVCFIVENHRFYCHKVRCLNCSNVHDFLAKFIRNFISLPWYNCEGKSGKVSLREKAALTCSRDPAGFRNRTFRPRVQPRWLGVGEGYFLSHLSLARTWFFKRGFLRFLLKKKKSGREVHNPSGTPSS